MQKAHKGCIAQTKLESYGSFPCYKWGEALIKAYLKTIPVNR